MENLMNKLVESKLMKWLEKVSVTLSESPTFSTIASGMQGNLGFIMVGAVIQVGLAIANMVFGLPTTNEWYIRINSIYNTTMGLLSLMVTFNIAFNYAKRLGMKGHNVHGFTAIVCYILVCAPITTYTLADGSTVTAINTQFLGATGLFVAIIIGLLSVRISKFCIDHNWVITMPDSVPEGVLNSFNNIIPILINIVVWYGLSTALSVLTNGQLTIPTLIIFVLSIPLNALLSPIGMLVIIIFGQLLWFFGIHGTSVVFSVMMLPMIMAYQTNASLYEAGQPLLFSYVFLWGANAMWGGSGNTLPLVLMGLRSKSKTIKAVSKAALPAGIFNINEPAVFGYPIMYNPLFLIPYVFGPVIVYFFYWAAYAFELIALPRILILTTLPIFMSHFSSTLSVTNVIFAVLMFPVVWLTWYPFFKMYEKKMVAEEEATEAE